MSLAHRRSYPSPPSQEDGHSREALARLIPLWPEDLLDHSLDGRRRLVAKLERALRAERRRAHDRSHAYDLARHVQLARAYRCEREALSRFLSGRNDNGAEPRAAREYRSR